MYVVCWQRLLVAKEKERLTTDHQPREIIDGRLTLPIFLSTTNDEEEIIMKGRQAIYLLARTPADILSLTFPLRLSWSKQEIRKRQMKIELVVTENLFLTGNLPKIFTPGGTLMLIEIEWDLPLMEFHWHFFGLHFNS